MEKRGPSYLKIVLWSLALLEFFFCGQAADSQIVTTIAGNAGAGYTGDGVLATTTSLNNPAAIAVDSQNNIYIADSFNYRVRKVNGATNIITTVAGNGISGFFGDGGPGTAAEIGFPFAVCTDSLDNLYIADSINNCIRKLNTAGIITTVAGIGGSSGYTGDGGPATSALMGRPAGVAVDSKGNIFIADYSYYIIRRVDGTTGIITTIGGKAGIPGGTGDGGPALSGTFGELDSLGVDAQGNVYVADESNDSIRKITVATGILSDFAGNGISGYSGDGGLATGAEFNYTGSTYFDSLGNAYITDENNAYIRRVDPTGIITTIAGSGLSSFCGDGGPPLLACFQHPEDTIVDSLGNIYVADLLNNRVRKITGLISTPTPTPTLTATSTATWTPTPPPTLTSTPTYTPPCQTHLWPDPFNPYYAFGGVLNVSCLPAQATVSFYTLSGELAQNLMETGGMVQWNGRNLSGAPVSSGIYYYVIQQGNQVLGTGKFLIMNDH